MFASQRIGLVRPSVNINRSFWHCVILSLLVACFLANASASQCVKSLYPVMFNLWVINGGNLGTCLSYSTWAFLSRTLQYQSFPTPLVSSFELRTKSSFLSWPTTSFRLTLQFTFGTWQSGLKVVSKWLPNAGSRKDLLVTTAWETSERLYSSPREGRSRLCILVCPSLTFESRGMYKCQIQSLA